MQKLSRHSILIITLGSNQILIWWVFCTKAFSMGTSLITASWLGSLGPPQYASYDVSIFISMCSPVHVKQLSNWTSEQFPNKVYYYLPLCLCVWHSLWLECSSIFLGINFSIQPSTALRNLFWCFVANSEPQSFVALYYTKKQVWCVSLSEASWFFSQMIG